MSLVRSDPITGLSAWLPEELSDADVTLSLNRAQKVACEELCRDGKSSTDEIVLNQLGDLIVDQCEAGVGFCIVRGFDPSFATRELRKRFFLAFCNKLGNLVSQNSNGDMLCEVTDVNKGKMKDSSVRGYQTNEALKPHTDSSDILALFCDSDAVEGGMSSVISAATIYNKILAKHRDLLPIYYLGFFYGRRSQIKENEMPAYRNPVFHFDEGKLSCRYYLVDYIENGYSALGIPFTALEKKAVEVFNSIAGSKELQFSFQMQPGDMVFYSNNTVLHGRTAFSDAQKTGQDNRTLFRVWLNPNEPRKLPDYFAKFRFGH